MSLKDRKFLGMLTPSSNTTLEPVVSRMLEGVPGVTGHYGRFKVTEIALQRTLGENPAIGSVLVSQPKFAFVVGTRVRQRSGHRRECPFEIVPMNAALPFVEGVRDFVVLVADLAFPDR